MRYFYDTEFIDNGYTLELISIGVVAEDGREYYGISTEFNPNQACKWVHKNVLSKLPSPYSQLWRSKKQIRLELEEFFNVSSSNSIELWAWISGYDHVVLCQLWGSMTDVPSAIPSFTHELRQLWEDSGLTLLPAKPEDKHNALTDARYNLKCFLTMTKL